MQTQPLYGRGVGALARVEDVASTAVRRCACRAVAQWHEQAAGVPLDRPDVERAEVTELHPADPVERHHTVGAGRYVAMFRRCLDQRTFEPEVRVVRRNR